MPYTLYAYRCMCLCVWIYIYILTHIYTHINVYKVLGTYDIYIYRDIYTYIYIHIRIYIGYIYIYIYIYILNLTAGKNMPVGQEVMAHINLHFLMSHNKKQCAYCRQKKKSKQPQNIKFAGFSIFTRLPIYSNVLTLAFHFVISFYFRKLHLLRIFSYFLSLYIYIYIYMYIYIGGVSNVIVVIVEKI